MGTPEEKWYLLLCHIYGTFPDKILTVYREQGQQQQSENDNAYVASTNPTIITPITEGFDSRQTRVDFDSDDTDLLLAKDF